MRYLLVPLSLWLMCCFAAPAQAVEQLVDFGFDQNFPPQTFVQNKQPTGFAVDILYAVLTGTEFRLMAEPGKWADVQRNLAAGTIDVSAGMGKTLEREKLYLFPAFPYDRFDAVVIVPEKSAVKSRTDLKGLTVATQKGSLYQQILERIGNISIKLYPSEAEALIAMTRGKADAFCGAEKTALYNIKQKKSANCAFSIPRCIPTCSTFRWPRKDLNWPRPFPRGWNAFSNPAFTTSSTPVGSVRPTSTSIRPLSKLA